VPTGSGSYAWRAVAQIVLLDNKFVTLLHAVDECRRVIGNIERAHFGFRPTGDDCAAQRNPGFVDITLIRCVTLVSEVTND
jgi:hypothetical protein